MNILSPKPICPECKLVLSYNCNNALWECPKCLTSFTPEGTVKLAHVAAEDYPVIKGPSSKPPPTDFIVGDFAIKVGGDYVFMGRVRAVFLKASGAIRVVVENGDGVLHIYNPSQLKKV